MRRNLPFSEKGVGRGPITSRGSLYKADSTKPESLYGADRLTKLSSSFFGAVPEVNNSLVDPRQNKDMP